MSNTIQDLLIQLGMDTSELNSKLDESWGNISDFAERTTQALEAVGLALGLKELGEEALGAFASVQKASISLTALTGNAELANSQIEQLKALALNESLSFPELLAANQKMTALGFSVAQIQGTLKAAADAAGAMGTDVGAASDAIDRMVLSGNVGARQLVALGLSTTDLAQVMGVAEDQVKKTFMALDQDQRLQVITDSLQKYGGVAGAQANSLAGQWQELKNEVEFAAEDIGKALAPLASDFMTEVREDILPNVKVLIVGLEELAHEFTALSGTAKTALIDIGVALAANPYTAFAVSVLQLANATLSAIEASKAAKQANEDQYSALQRLEVSMHQTGIDTSDLTKQYGQGIISQEQYLQGLTKLAHAFQEAHGLMPAPASTPPAPVPISLPDVTEKTNFKGIPFAEMSTDNAILLDQTKQLGESIAKTESNIASYGLTMAKAGVEIDQTALSDSYFSQQTVNAGIAMGNAEDSIPPVIDQMGNLSKTGELTAESQKEVAKQVGEFGKVLDSLYGKVKPPFDALHESIFQIDKDLASGNFAQIHTIISKLALDDLPSAVKEQDLFVSALEAANAPASELSKQIQLQIQLHAQLGQSMNKEVIQLANLDEKQKIIAASTNVWGKAYQGLLTDINQFGAGLAKNLAAGIVEGQKFGQIFSNIWKQFAEAILTTAITALEQLAVKWIAGLLGISVAQKAANTSAILGEGGVTFAAAFASVMETVPFPFNVALAPAVAGAELGTMLGVALPMAAAAQGAYLTEDMVIAAGADELVLPPNLATGIKGMIESGNTRPGGTGSGTMEPPTGLIDMRGSNFTGVTRDTVDALATSLVRKAIAARALR